MARKERGKGGKILLIKLRSEKYSTNKEIENIFELHTEQKKMMRLLNYITTQWPVCIDLTGVISFIS